MNMDKIDQIRRWLSPGREFTVRTCWAEIGGSRSEVQQALERLHGKGEVARVGKKMVKIGELNRTAIVWRGT